MKIKQWLRDNSDNVDWNEIYERWGKMQEVHNPFRSLQIKIIVDSVKALSFEKINVIDLCCGPGTLAKELLNSDERINVIGIDADPFLLKIFEKVISRNNGRSSFFESDIRRRNVFSNLANTHAVVSFTSLHWLTQENQRILYKNIYSCLNNGGIFMNGDRLKITSAFFRGVEYGSKNEVNGETWDKFWEGLYHQYDFRKEMEEMNNDLSIWEGTDDGYPREFYLSSLKQAGFKEAEVLYQIDDRVVYGGRK